MQNLLTGEMVSAQEAHRIGLVNEVVPAADLMKRAEEIAKKIVANAPLAVWATRRVVLGSAGEGDDVGWRLTDEAFAEIIRSEDFAEGPRAFVEKRPPEWKGR